MSEIIELNDLKAYLDKFRINWLADTVKKYNLDETEYETLIELLTEELDNAPCYCDFVD